MAVEHTFPPEIWGFICAALVDQKQPSSLWAASVTSVTFPARDALRALCSSSQMLRRIAQPLLLQYYHTRDEVEGLGSFCRNIMSKPQLASLVRGFEVACCPFYAVDRDILREVASHFGFNLAVFQVPVLSTLWDMPWGPGRETVTNLSLLAHLVPYLLPNLKCLQIRLGPHKRPELSRQDFLQLRNFRPLASVTTLVLAPQTGLGQHGCTLDEYEPLFASLPNLRTLSLWGFQRISDADYLHGLYAGLPAWPHPVDEVGQWLPPGLRSLHLRRCVLSHYAMMSLLLNCRALEHLLYAPEDASSPVAARQAVAYFEVVRMLRTSAADKTVRYLDLDIGSFKRRTWRHMLDLDLAAMWEDVRRLPRVERVAVEGAVHECRKKTPQEDGDTYSSDSDWTWLKASGDVEERTRDFQRALGQASRL